MEKKLLRDLFSNSLNDDKVPKCKVIDAECHNGFGFVIVTDLLVKDIKRLLNNIVIFYKDKRFDVRIATDRKNAKHNIEKNKEKKLLVTNIPKKITHIELEEYFSFYGKVDKAYVALDPVNGYHKGFGFVIFERLEDS